MRCLIDALEPLFRVAITRIYVRVMFASKSPVSVFDLFLGGATRDAKCGVEVFAHKSLWNGVYLY